MQCHLWPPTTIHVFINQNFFTSWNICSVKFFGVCAFFCIIDALCETWLRVKAIFRQNRVLSLLLFVSLSFCFWSRFHLDPSGTYTQYDAKAIGMHWARTLAFKVRMLTRYILPYPAKDRDRKVHRHHCRRCTIKWDFSSQTGPTAVTFSCHLNITRLFLKSMTIEEAEEKLLQILKQVMEEKLTSTNVEVSFGNWFL